MDKIFKIRASATGQIMTMPKTKKAKEAGELSATAKTYCQSWLMEQLYNRRKSFSSKYTSKGLEVESESIDYVAEQLNWGLVFKNDEWRDGDYITGTPDIVHKDSIIDIKNSWEAFTFPLFDAELKNKAYWWQIQSYLSLWNMQKGSVVYLLSNTPEHIVEREIVSEMYKQELEEVPKGFAEHIMENHQCDNIDASLRIKVFHVERDDAAIEMINLQVMKCREYIKELSNQININN